MFRRAEPCVSIRWIALEPNEYPGSIRDRHPRRPWSGSAESPYANGCRGRATRRLATKSAPVTAKCIEQSLTQHHIAIAVPLTAMDVNHHPLAVDITDLQMCSLDAAGSSAIKRHEQNAIERLLRCLERRATSSWLRISGSRITFRG